MSCAFEHYISPRDYRFGQQGQFAEKDNETGWNAFELRMLDSRIGRWLATDPAKQFASPFVALGNNPVNRFDPNGAFSPPTDLVDINTGKMVGYIDDGIDQIAFVSREEATDLMGMWDVGAKSDYFQLLATVPKINFAQLIFESPIRGNYIISSEFKSDRKVGSSPHVGTDYAVPSGTPVYATASGLVTNVWYSNSNKVSVILKHGNSDGTPVYTYYTHGSLGMVTKGSRVSAGDLLMYSGDAGTGPHLHYEVIKTSAEPRGPGFFNNINERYFPSDLRKLLDNTYINPVYLGLNK
ncbi:MAG: peptidoglycan DD-metalloendopeptidase family protein [Bacteroidota bacterium]|nr:peptidoglycan DD-metalloendopeptidase family protein [Bacteroidota bacterium]